MGFGFLTLFFLLSFKGLFSLNNQEDNPVPLLMIKKKKLDNRNTYTGLEFKEQ